MPIAIALVSASLWSPGATAAETPDHQESSAHVVAGDHEDAAEKGVDPLATDLDLAIWTLLIFVCLAVLLKKVAWGPIVKALDAREEGISDNIAAAAAKHEEAKQLLAEHQAKINAAADDVRAMLDEARRDAEVTKTRIVSEARSAADAERQRALREIDQAKEGAIKGLAEQSARLAIDLATKVVKQDITQQRQGEIVREALGLMASSDGNKN
jgi:F-type H+-transporting ATPase subunit b